MQVILKGNRRRLQCSCKSNEMEGISGDPENVTYSCAECGAVLYIRKEGKVVYKDQQAKGTN